MQRLLRISSWVVVLGAFPGSALGQNFVIDYDLASDYGVGLERYKIDINVEPSVARGLVGGCSGVPGAPLWSLLLLGLGLLRRRRS